MNAFCLAPEAVELGSASWLRLRNEDPRYTLSAAGLRSAPDCGWVEQMLPFIDAFSKPADTVLDPFSGWGSTLLAAALRGRRALGVELDGRRVEVSRQRLGFHQADATVICGDACQLPVADGCVDLALTSVPYFSAGQFGAAAQSPATATHFYGLPVFDAYLRLLRQAFSEVARVLVPGGYFVAMVENVRVAGRFVPLAWECGRLLESLFEIGDERIIVYDQPENANCGLLSNRAHEYALICRKR